MHTTTMASASVKRNFCDPSGSGLREVLRKEVPVGVHALVQYSDDLDDIRPDRSIIENVRRMPDLVSRVLAARMPQMEAPQTGQDFAAVCDIAASRLTATRRIAAARTAAYRRRASIPHRSALVARIRARSACAGRDRR